ncbi:hypothetical protein V3O24_13290 [Methylobacter sp. Wu8]|uniref:hypothetical protein n=1 Tax=Methylobacter sp. Wu8 TaxID=3118457 RepID=UPI002F33D599
MSVKPIELSESERLSGTPSLSTAVHHVEHRLIVTGLFEAAGFKITSEKVAQN